MLSLIFFNYYTFLYTKAVFVFKYFYFSVVINFLISQLAVTSQLLPKEIFVQANIFKT